MKRTEPTIMRIQPDTHAMLKELVKRAASEGYKMSMSDMVNYMIETQYPGVHRMFTRKSTGRLYDKLNGESEG